MGKNKLGIILIILILFLSAFITISEKKDKNNTEPLELETKIETPEKNIPKTNENEMEKKALKENHELLNEKGYSSAKRINYDIAIYFKNLNDKRLDNIKLFPEYMEFLGVSTSEYLDLKYKTDDLYFYEIVDIEEMREYNKILVKLKHKYENSEGIFFETFSLGDGFILDEAYLFVKEIDELVNYKGIDFLVDSKAIFNDKAIYKVIVKNNGKDTFFIDDDKYGFYAIQDINKYYHRFELGNITSYRVQPYTEKTLFICFDNLRGEADVYVKIGGKEILLTTN